MKTILLLLLALGLSMNTAPAEPHTDSFHDARPASATGGELELSPERPLRGESVSVVYRPSPALAGEPQLILRARLRTPNDGPYNRGFGSSSLAVLEILDDGSFAGSFTLPEGVVYAALAVEDLHAEHTDTRNGRFWQVMVYGDDGRPTIDALEQRFNDLMGRDQLAVLETARTVVRLHPEKPRGWNLLRAAETWVLPREGADERGKVHRKQFESLDAALREREDLDADDVGYMYWYAADAESRERWRSRLLEEYPGHLFAVQEEIGRLHREHRDDQPALLAALDSLWHVHDELPARERIATPGFGAAQRAGDHRDLLLWAERLMETEPDQAGWVASALSRAETTSEEAIEWIRSHLEHVAAPPDDKRPLGSTAADYRKVAERDAAAVRFALGQALLTADRPEEALGELKAAAEVGWHTPRLRRLGEASLAAGDLDGAVQAFAAVAADPATADSTAEALRESVDLEPEAWANAVSDARAEMLRRTMAEADLKAIEPAAVETWDGASAPLSDLLGEPATVVAVLSRHCGFSVHAMPQIESLAGRLAPGGVSLVALTRDSRAETESFLEERGWDLQFVLDPDGEAERALNAWGTPYFYVLDGSGRIRFGPTSLDAIERQVAALKAERDGLK